MLKTILSISGKPGLFKLVSHGKNMLNGQQASVSTSAKPDELRAYFAEILPNFDRERVYPSDIKKLISWYNILIGAGLTEFTPEESATEEASVKETKKEEA